jgi:hypothetical protein
MFGILYDQSRFTVFGQQDKPIMHPALLFIKAFTRSTEGLSLRESGWTKAFNRKLCLEDRRANQENGRR